MVYSQENSTFLTSNSLQKPIYFLGISGGLNLNNYKANFFQLPGFPNCCRNFNIGSGTGFNFGIFYEKPEFLGNDKLSLNLKLIYNNFNGTFNESNPIGNVKVRDNLDTSKIIIVAASSNHYLSSKISNLGLQPTLKYNFYDNFNFGFGFNLSYLMTHTFTQYEELTNPPGYTYENHKLKRNDSTDKVIPEAKSIQAYLNLGLSYDFKMKNNWVISPEVAYNLGLLNVSSVNCKINTIQVIASLKMPIYPPINKEIQFDTIYKRDTAIVIKKGITESYIKLINEGKKTEIEEFPDVILNTIKVEQHYEKYVNKNSIIEMSMEIYGVKPDGSRQKEPTIEIEEIETEESFPILPYVFFKENSYDLNLSNQNLLSAIETQDFDEKKLKWNSIDIYHDALNIIGKRMTNNPKINITITGCNNNKASEENNLTLSSRRAEVVKDYLVNNWLIEPNRITIFKRNLPLNPGNNNIPEGIEENQRAEINSGDFNMLKPLNLREVQTVSNPPVVEIETKIESDEELKNYNLNISQSGATIRNYNGDIKDIKINYSSTKLPNSYINTSKWNLTEKPIPKLESPLNFKLEASNNYNETKEIEKKLSIKQKTLKFKRDSIHNDKKIENFSLIVFDYDQSKLNEIQKKILAEVKNKIQPESQVRVIGYTDKTGDAEYNMNLALKRCLEVKSFLNLNEKNISFEAVGSKNLLYDNNSPQGRSYCRTVKIRVETPIKK